MFRWQCLLLVSFLPSIGFGGDCGLGDCRLGDCGLGDCGLGCERPFWVEADYLGWFIKGNHVPPLVTTSPDTTPRSQAGVLGPNSSVLYGGEEIDDDYRSGLRIRGGLWMDPCRDHVIEVDYLTLFDDSNSFFASTSTPIGNGNGLPILARPFFNVETGAEDAELVSYPGVVDGSIQVHSSSQLESAQILCRTLRYCGSRGRLDVVVGYRYFEFDEALTISEDLVVTESGGLIANGTRIEVFDAFETDNSFHGGQLGFSAEFWREYITLQLRGGVALGGITRETSIRGGTQNTPPGGGTASADGGLLALSTNIGDYRASDFAALSEFGANLRVQLTQRTQLSVGYTLLLLNDVARTGNAIDRSINPGFLPGAVLVDPTERPTFRGETESFYAHGLNVGLVITN